MKSTLSAHNLFPAQTLSDLSRKCITAEMPLGYPPYTPATLPSKPSRLPGSKRGSKRGRCNECAPSHSTGMILKESGTTQSILTAKFPKKIGKTTPKFPKKIGRQNQKFPKKIGKTFGDSPKNIILDTKIQELLRQYYYVGGMPEAVLDYTTHGDVNKIRKIQKAILKTYDNDFAKHAGSETERIRLVWKSIPAQLAKENKKFIYGAVKPGGRARDLESAIQWLVDAKLAFKVHRFNKPTMPLSFYEDFNAFKLFTLDVGLLGAMANAPASLMLTSNDVFKEFKGAFSENYVFEQLRTLDDLSIYYYSKENSTQEIDFLVQTDERIIPIEVKAEENLRSKSLRGFVVDDYPNEHLKGLRCSMKPYIDQDWMENIPLYGILGYINKKCFCL